MDSSDFDIPDAFWPASGFKVFRLRAHVPTLESPYYGKNYWHQTGELKARCGYGGNRQLPKHDCPAPVGIHEQHPCGIYAHYHLKNLVIKESPKLLHNMAKECYGALVIGVMEGWGTVEAHESDGDGWRAEHARIAALCRPTEKLDPTGLDLVNEVLQGICDHLGIPYIERSEAEDLAAEIGVNLAPSQRRE